MKREREQAVLEAAIEQIKKPDGFIVTAYLARKDTDDYWQLAPGPDIVATCAVGGIEQAVWKVTGDAPRTTGKGHYPSSRHSLYGRVLGKCNRIARELYPNGLGYYDKIHTIEQLTFAARTPESARKHVLRVLRAAKREYASA